jgi:hypothetical protein
MSLVVIVGFVVGISALVYLDHVLHFKEKTTAIIGFFVYVITPILIAATMVSCSRDAWDKQDNILQCTLVNSYPSKNFMDVYINRVNGSPYTGNQYWSKTLHCDHKYMSNMTVGKSLLVKVISPTGTRSTLVVPIEFEQENDASMHTMLQEAYMSTHSGSANHVP